MEEGVYEWVSIIRAYQRVWKHDLAARVFADHVCSSKPKSRTVARITKRVNRWKLHAKLRGDTCTGVDAIVREDTRRRLRRFELLGLL